MKANRSVHVNGLLRGGVPIIGQQPQAPEGRHYYEVPVLITWPGEPLAADSFEFAFPLPMNGPLYKGLAPQIASHLQKVRAAELAAADGVDPASVVVVDVPRIVVLAPIFLGFVPQEEIDAQKAAAEAEKEKPC